MSKFKPAIVSHSDENSYYAADSRSHRIQRQREKREDRKKKAAAKAEKAKLWNEQKKKLYLFAHSQDRTADAELHLMNTRRYYDEKDVKKLAKKMQYKHYKALCRESKQFFK